MYAGQGADNSPASGEVPLSSLVSSRDVKSKEPKNQFSSRRPPNAFENSDSRSIRKPPIPVLSEKQAEIPAAHKSGLGTGNIFDGSDKSGFSPQQSQIIKTPGLAPSPSALNTVDQNTCRRVGPQLSDEARDSAWSLNKSIHECVSLGDSELFFVTKQIVLCIKNNKATSEKNRAPIASSTSIWGNMMEAVHIRQDESQRLAAEEAAQYMASEYSGRFAVVLNSPYLSKVSWNGPIHLVEESAHEPAPLQESVMLLLFLEKYLMSSPDRLVLFFEGNVSVVACLIRLLDQNAASKSAKEVLAEVHELRRESVPLAGARRYLAMLEACMQAPQMIECAPDMTVASLRLYGDPDFVKSTESLIRVHAEIHHARGIDSTDLREPLCRRITRGAEADACLLISFIPVRLAVRSLMCRSPRLAARVSRGIRLI